MLALINSLKYTAIFTLGVGLIQTAQAVHLFTQGGDGDNPVFISAGQSFNVTIDADSMDPNSVSPQGFFSVYFSDGWSAGDTIRFNTPSG